MEVTNDTEETIEYDTLLEEYEFMEVAPAAPAHFEPDIVLYITAHGIVTDDPFTEKIRWFSTLPINGCPLVAFSNEDTHIELLKNAYKNQTTQKSALRQFCRAVDQTDFKRDELKRYLHSYLFHFIVDNYIWFTQNNSNVFVHLMEKMRDAITIRGVLELNPQKSMELIQSLSMQEQLRQFEKIVILNDFLERTQRELIRDAPTPEHRRRLYEIKRGESLIFSMENIISRKDKLKCKFMHIKKDKSYYFTEENNGVYIIFHSKPFPPKNEADIERIVFQNGTVGFYFKQFARQENVRLREIIEYIKNMGFKNIIVYDISCNARARPDEIRERKLSSMASYVSSATPTSAGSRRRKSRRRSRRRTLQGIALYE